MIPRPERQRLNGKERTGVPARLRAAVRPPQNPPLTLGGPLDGPFAEAYRMIRANLSLTDGRHGSRVLVLTSALEGEGKSTVAANLAMALAQQGKKTLLIEADLRRGALHEVFATEPSPGFADVLTSRVALREAIHSIPTAGFGLPLEFLSAGTSPANPADLLGAANVAELLREVREEYDIVILDTPPLMMVADAVLLGRMADGIILVARAGFTTGEVLRQSVEQIDRLRIPLSGVVLNGVDPADGSFPHYGRYASKEITAGV
jgi:capsular exopolysaccharide synthesis family protein